MALLFQLKHTLSQGFLAAWALWPRKDKKIDAQKAWNQKVTDDETEAKVFDAFKWQVPMLLERDPQYRPLLGSWLRGEEWNNEQPMPKTINRPTAITPMVQQQLDASTRIKALVATGMDSEQAKQQVYREMGWVK